MQRGVEHNIRETTDCMMVTCAWQSGGEVAKVLRDPPALHGTGDTAQVPRSGGRRTGG